MVVENNKKLVKPKLVNIKKGGGFGNHPGPGRPPKTRRLPPLLLQPLKLFPIIISGFCPHLLYRKCLK